MRGRASEVELVVRVALVGVGVEFFGGEARDAPLMSEPDDA